MKNAAVACAIGLLSMAAFLSSTCVSAGSSSADLSASIRLVVDGLDYPANFVAEDERRTLVLEKDQGTIRVVEDGRILDEKFLDIHSRLIGEPNIEEGLLSAALPPTFPADPSIYVSYVAADGNLRLSRFRVVDGGYHALPDRRRSCCPCLRTTGRTTAATSHSDRRTACSTYASGTRRTIDYGRDTARWAPPLRSSPGRMARSSASNLGPGEPGRSLPGRPAVAGTGIVRAEFWAYGLRNPWRFAFDRETGDVLIPDVGRYHWEELNYRPAVENGLLNYGWPLAEGNACALRCGGNDLVWPIYQHPSRDLNRTRTGTHMRHHRRGDLPRSGLPDLAGGLCFRRLLQRRGLGSARFRKQARATEAGRHRSDVDGDRDGLSWRDPADRRGRRRSLRPRLSCRLGGGLGRARGACANCCCRRTEPATAGQTSSWTSSCAAAAINWPSISPPFIIGSDQHSDAIAPRS